MPEDKKIKDNKKVEVSEEQKKTDKSIMKEVVIHSMPKRFFKAEPEVQKSKGVGILIFIGGGIFLVAMAAIMYYFIFKKAPPKVEAPIENPIVNEYNAENEEEKKSEEEANTANGENNKEEITEKTPEKVISTSTDDILEASSTENITDSGTTTKKKVSAVDMDTPNTNILKDAGDLDSDGLFDLEEELLGTKKESRDSDGDGYEDLSEFMNMYNPAGTGSLMVNDDIVKYSNPQYGYYFYRPKSWEVDNIDGDTSVLFKALNNQFVQIIIQSNNSNQSLEEWYIDQFGVIRVEQRQKLYKKGWLAIESVDGLSTYLMHPENGNIFVMTYSIGIDNVLYYKNIYQLMIKSLELE